MTPEEQTQVQEPEGGGRRWRTGFRGREAPAEGELTAKQDRRTLLQEDPEWPPPEAPEDQPTGVGPRKMRHGTGP